MIGRSRFGLYLGRIFGIKFYLDYSWFIIAAILTYELAAKLFPASLPGQSQTAYCIMGLVTALTFFLSILLHELGHSLVSQRCGIPVPRITLMFIGGIAEISREPDNAKAELKIAAGGPLTSVGLSMLYGAGAIACGMAGWNRASLILQWLTEANLALVIFNAIPGYPMDGGRILRSIIWARTGNIRKATYITTRIGVGFSWVLMGLGVASMGLTLVPPYQGSWNSLVLILVGLFLKSAAESGYTNTVYHEVLSGVRVGDIMNRTPICIPAHTPLNIAVDEYFLAKNHTAYPVIGDEGEFRGILRLENLKELPREKWAYVSAGDLVAAQEPIAGSIDIGQPAETAMRRLVAAGQGKLAVMDAGKVVGIVTRHDVLAFITVHSELKL